MSLGVPLAGLPGAIGTWSHLRSWVAEGQYPVRVVPVAVGMALAIAVLPLQYAAVLVIGLVVAWLILVKLDFGLWALAFAVPFASLWPVPLGSVTVTATDALVALTLGAWLLRGLARRHLWLRFGGVHVALLLFLVVLVTATVCALDPQAGVKEILRWLELGFVYLVVAQHVRTDKQWRLLALMVLLAGSAEALVGIYQFFARVGPESFALGRFMRASGTFSQPNPFAGYLGMVLPVALSLALGGWLLGVGRGTRRIAPSLLRPLRESVSWTLASVPLGPLLSSVAWVAGGLVIVAMAFSLSRGAWLGATVAVAVMASLASRRGLKIVCVFIVVIVLFLLLGAVDVLPESISSRLAQVTDYFGVFDARQVAVTSENWAIVERMARWQSAWGMFQDQPLIGVGPGNYVVAYAQYALPGWENPLGHAHNFYLHVLAEMGLVGASVYLLLIAGWLRHGIGVLSRLKGAATSVARRGLKGLPLRSDLASIVQDYRQRALLALGLVGVLAAVLAHSFFDNLYVHDMNVQIGLTLGLIAALGALSSPDRGVPARKR